MKLPFNIRTQVSKNHTDWALFCDSICNLEYGIHTIPDERVYNLELIFFSSYYFPVPTPWHRLPLPLTDPEDPDFYSIGTSPSNSRLVIELTRQTPPMYRCDHPDPTQSKNRKKQAMPEFHPEDNEELNSDPEEEDEEDKPGLFVFNVRRSS